MIIYKFHNIYLKKFFFVIYKTSTSKATELNFLIDYVLIVQRILGFECDLNEIAKKHKRYCGTF
ncbi:hypothetical protein SDC9_92311 [bioreactor metagenome]|uniref:Uncharacterized protein n=1 Tax=bioreactor metagenome TaxID=1076179 RepID=A0A645A440_9ZZZZ